MGLDGDERPAADPTFGEILSVWARIGVLSFGGPAGQIALMHRVLVDEKRWLTEAQFLSALNFCMLLPGPEAMQLATYSGWRVRGVLGGLAAGLLFVLPGAAVVLVLSAIYAALGTVPLIAAIFLGVKAAVLAIVIEALMRVSRRALKVASDWWIAGAAFVGIFALHVPFPVIIAIAAMVGYLRTASTGVPSQTEAAPSGSVRDVGLHHTFATIVAGLTIWLAPITAITFALGDTHVLSQIGWFFSKLAVVTFGGAYAVLAYMAQEVVGRYGWLTPGEMLDGLGLAETTPGPLILVTQFVGFLAAFREGGWPLALAGAATTLWATFAPCFLWIFAGAPYVDWINRQPRLSGALSAVTAAVVGVILNLSVWFGLAVLFQERHEIAAGPLRLVLPSLDSAAPLAMLLVLVAAVVLFWLRRGVLTTLVVCASAAAMTTALPG